jgi:hypothetical protein
MKASKVIRMIRWNRLSRTGSIDLIGRAGVKDR